MAFLEHVWIWLTCKAKLDSGPAGLLSPRLGVSATAGLAEAEMEAGSIARRKLLLWKPGFESRGSQRTVWKWKLLPLLLLYFVTWPVRVSAMNLGLSACSSSGSIYSQFLISRFRTKQVLLTFYSMASNTSPDWTSLWSLLIRVLTSTDPCILALRVLDRQSDLKVSRNTNNEWRINLSNSTSNSKNLNVNKRIYKLRMILYKKDSWMYMCAACGPIWVHCALRSSVCMGVAAGRTADPDCLLRRRQLYSRPRAAGIAHCSDQC